MPVRIGNARGWLWLGLAIVFLGPVGFRHYASSLARLTRYAHGKLSFTDHRVLADFDWIARNVPKDEVIFNAPADWGLARPFTGHRYVYFSGGVAHAPKTKWAFILRSLNRPREHFPAGLGWLSGAGIRHVFSATYAEDRAPLDREALRINPALEQVYSSDTGAVFQLRRFWVRYVDLEQPHVAGAQLSGFHEVEENSRPDGLIVSPIFRWTNGEARVTLLDIAERGVSCLFSVAAPEGRRFQVFLDGQELSRAPVGFVVPAERVPARSLTFEIRSETTNKGNRQLGIQVTGAGLFCTRP